MIRIGTKDDNLIGYWKFDDGAGMLAIDSSDSGNDGTLVNMEEEDWVSGIFKDALQFDGVLEHVLVSSADYNFQFTDSFSISCWIKTNIGTQRLIIDNRTANYPYYILRVNGDVIQFQTGTDVTHLGSITGRTTMSDGEWHHIVAVRNVITGKLYLYVDGSEDATPTTDNSGNIGTNQIKIGCHWIHTGFGIVGKIDEVAIYNDILSASEVLALYHTPGLERPLCDVIVWESLNVEQNLTSQVDSAGFKYRKFGSRTWSPGVSDEIEIWDDEEQIFGGTIITMKESIVAGDDGLVYDIKCVDWTYELDNELVSESYESKTISQIITDMIDNYATGFTYVNVSSDFLIDKIVFNQVPISQCLKRLADIVKYEWYVDTDKDIHFFSKFTNTAPFDLTDSSGNYVYKSLLRNIDGKQLANRVKVRGGEYDADTFEDEVTVSGDLTKSFKLPYKFSGLSVWLDVGAGYVAQDVGIDFIDDFTTDDVLYNYNDMTIRWETALADGDKIKFSGKPKVPVLAIASDAISIAEFGIKEKLIRDTSIEDIQTARKRAMAELDAYKDEIDDASFKTYTSGLRTGMVINLQSTVRDSIDVNYIIKKVVFKMVDPENFVYNIGLVTTRKYGFIELLQKLLEPESKQADDSEVAETIETDILDITITELIDVTLAVDTDAIDVVIVENIEKDPLGLDTEPDWVLAPYFPEIQYLDCESTVSWTNFGGGDTITYSVDTDNFKESDGSLKLSVDVSATVHNFCAGRYSGQPNLDISLYSSSKLTFWIYLDAEIYANLDANYPNINLFTTVDTNYIQFNSSFASQITSSGWTYIELDLDSPDLSGGSFDFSDFDYMRFGIHYDASTNDFVWRLDDIRFRQSKRRVGLLDRSFTVY